MSSPFNYTPTQDEEKLMLPYITTIIVGCNDGTGIPRNYLFPTLTLLWVVQEKTQIPLDVAFSVSGPQSFHLIRLLNQLENTKTILRVCVSCGQYVIKPSSNVPRNLYYPHLCITSAIVYSKIKSLCQGGRQWTTNVLCGLFSKGGGINIVVNKQSEFARMHLNETSVKDIINSLYSPIVGKTLII